MQKKEKEIMELCLFFMPQCMPYDPYPALPYLTGYLRKRNVDVQQFDANHGFYEYLLEKKNLIEMSKLVKQDFAELKRKKTLNNEEKKKYNNYLNEYSCAATPQIRQTGNRLSGLAETAYASLLAQCFV